MSRRPAFSLVPRLAGAAVREQSDRDKAPSSSPARIKGPLTTLALSV
jgi:hypothetical protein